MLKHFASLGARFALCFYFLSCAAYADNPLVKGVGMADPHIRIFDNKAYLYSTRDADPKSKEWVMPDWHVWSSDDLINWKHETVFKPEETYIGPSNYCWASDAEQRNGKTYLYFSNHNIDTGVAVAESPTGPFKDALGKPMLAKDLTPIKEYDITVLTDDDKDRTPYIAFGHFRDYMDGYYYAIAKMNEDMVSLAEKPRKIDIRGSFGGNDKPNLHKRKGTYYLSAGAKYAVADNIYGPYDYVGFSGGDAQPFGLSSQAHGNYFEWRNQWFHVWCEFVWGKSVAKFRESKMTYIHYKDNGQMVDDVAFLEKHYATGVGQYDAAWEKIEAEWYMGLWHAEKKENRNGGFEIQNISSATQIYFPNIHNLPTNSRLRLHYAANKVSQVNVRLGSLDGKKIGSCALPATGGLAKYQTQTCQLNHAAGTQTLYLTFAGIDKPAMSLDWIAF